MTKNVAGFRFTKAERGLLVSVFERFDGKTPSRGVCDAIARAFTRSPVRDPTRRALAAVDDDLAAAAPPPAAGVLLPGDAATTDNPCAVNAGFGLFAPSPFRGAAWRAAADAADGGAATAANGRGDGGANAFESDDATRLPAPETKYPYVVAPVPVVDASLSSLPTHAKTHPDEKNAFEEFFEESAEEAPEEAWADAVADARDTRDPRGAAAAALSSESGDGSSRDDETKSFLGTPHAETSAQTPSPLDAFVGRASRLERLVLLEKGVAAARNRAFQRDVAAWQPVGTSLYIGERAETATPTRARRVSSPSPSPPLPDPAPAVPFLPETPNVLASEENGGGLAAPLAAGASFFPRPGVFPDDPAWSGSELAGAENRASALADARDAGDDEDLESDGGRSVDASILTIASRGAIGALETRAGLGVAGLSALLGSSRAYAPGVSLEALVREKDDNLAAALALGARTGRWVPLTGGADDAEPRDDGGDGAAAFTHVAPSSAAQAAMVVSAAEELGDGEAHPVTWKQIKTWFENRRMTQKRIKEGNARPPRRNSNAGTHVAGADESADARAAKKANDRGKPPRPPPSGKTRSSAKGGGVSSSKGASKHERGVANDRDERHAFSFARDTDADPPAARRSLDETRFDATARPGAKRARTGASGKPLGLSARRSLEMDRLEMDRFDAAAAAAAAAEDLRSRDTSWGEPTSALTREMSWADIHDALAGAERARAP
jgi:hypothetical protein